MSQKIWGGLVIISIVALIMSSCSGVPVTAGLDTATLGAIDRALNALDRQPAQWESTLNSAIDELGRVGTVTANNITRNIQDIIKTTTQTIQSASFCEMDVLQIKMGQLVREELLKIRKTLDPTTQLPTLEPPPHICLVNLPDNGILPGIGTGIVHYSGYGLDVDRSKYSVILQYADGSILDNNFGTVNVLTNYEMNVRLPLDESRYARLDPTLYPEIVVKWDSQEVEGVGMQSTLPVLFPSPTPAPIVPDATATPIPILGTEVFTITFTAHAPIAPDGSNCGRFMEVRTIASGWKIDHSLGDSGHPGIQEMVIRGNKRGNDELSDYNYYVTSETTFVVEGRTCASASQYPGFSDAQFERDYKVFTIQNP